MEREEKLDVEIEVGTIHAGRNGSNLGALFNIVCAIAGAGTLGMPYSFRQGGWIAAGFIVLSGMVSWYTGVILIECIYYSPGKRLSSYPAIGEAAFGTPGRVFVQFFHYTIVLGVSTLYIMLAGINIEMIVAEAGASLKLSSCVMIAGGLILVPYAVARSLKETALLSLFGVVTTFATVVIACAIGLIDAKEEAPHSAVVWSGVPVSLATVGFSFGGNVIYTHVEAAMRKPKDWPTVLAGALTVVSLIYLMMGCIGYYAYGDLVQSPIMRSLPSGIPNLVASTSITLHLIVAAPLTLVAFSIEIETPLGISPAKLAPIPEKGFRFLFRLTLVVILTAIAILLPNFGAFMSLLGAISSLVIIYLTPVVCHLKLFGARNRSLKTYLSMAMCVVIGLLGGVLGAISAMHNLIAAFSRPEL